MAGVWVVSHTADRWPRPYLRPLTSLDGAPYTIDLLTDTHAANFSDSEADTLARWLNALVDRAPPSAGTAAGNDLTLRLQVRGCKVFLSTVCCTPASAA